MSSQDQHNNDDSFDRSSNLVPITLDISFELWERIAIAAHEENCPVEEYIGYLLEQIAAQPEDFLKHVQQTREQVMKESGGLIFEDSTELIRQMREERTRELMGEE